MSRCGICKKKVTGLVWHSAHTELDYCRQCMYDTHFDPRSKIDPCGNLRQKTSKEMIEAQPYYYADREATR